MNRQVKKAGIRRRGISIRLLSVEAILLNMENYSRTVYSPTVGDIAPMNISHNSGNFLALFCLKQVPAVLMTTGSY